MSDQPPPQMPQSGFGEQNQQFPGVYLAQPAVQQHAGGQQSVPYAGGQPQHPAGEVPTAYRQVPYTGYDVYGQWPPYGDAGFGAHDETPGRRSRLIVAIASVAVVVLAGAGFLGWWAFGGQEGTGGHSARAGSQGNAKDTVPTQKLGTPAVVKTAPEDLHYDKAAAERLFPPEKRDASKYPEFKGLTQVDSAYHPKSGMARMLTVHTGAGAVTNPAQRVEAAFSPNQMAVEPKDFGLKDPKAEGGVLRCGISQANDVYVGLCVWADSTSVGDVIAVGEDLTASSPADVDLYALAQQTRDLRRAMRGATAG